MHKNIVFNHSDHEPPCCSNTESQHARMTGSVKWRVMTPVQSGGLDAMTLKHGTPHSAPVKCLKKTSSCSISACWMNDSPPRCTPPHLPFYILLWPLSMSHLSSSPTLYCGARPIISLLSGSVMHRIKGLWTLPFRSTYIRK